MDIIFSDSEKQILDFLISVCPEGTILRLAGGFVRDKLMGLDSHDIDIAISNMSGKDFAKLVVAKLGPKSSYNIIEARPDQSKHLETAMVTIFGTSIDLVNLRKETYGQSRIPIIEFGTPEEDALRRDLTINALFYNLNTKQIEDFTGFGLNDLKLKIARTPIDATQTFLDDPLRLLRCVRFIAKYDLDCDINIFHAAKDPLVQEAFKNKISKERIWTELIGQEEPDGWKSGCLTGPNPVLALELLKEWGYIDLLFTPEGFELNSWDSDQCSTHHDLNIWQHTLEVMRQLNNEGHTPQDFAVRVLSVLYHDIGKCYPRFIQQHSDGIHLSYKEHEIGSADIAEKALSDKLNAPIEIKDRVVKLVRQHMRLHHLEDNPTNKALRHFIKDVGEDWPHSVDIAIADSNGKVNKNPGNDAKYETYRERIKELLLEQGGVIKPARPINGVELMFILNLKPSPTVGKVFAALDEKLLEDPTMSKEQAIEFICSIDLGSL